jgi:hypothetical protein
MESVTDTVIAAEVSVRFQSERAKNTAVHKLPLLVHCSAQGQPTKLRSASGHSVSMFADYRVGNVQEF